MQNFNAPPTNQTAGVSDVTVSTTQVPKKEKPLDANTIENRRRRMQQYPSPTYWQVIAPQRQLKLNNAAVYVSRNYPNAVGENRFVYWPPYRVAGTVLNIVNAFNAAGIQSFTTENGQQVALTAQNVYNTAIDPLTEQGRRLVESIPAGSGRKAAPAISLQQFIEMGHALNISSKTKGTAGETTTGGTVNKRLQTRRTTAINKFNEFMNQAINLAQTGGDVSSVINVTDFNPNDMTRAVSMNTPGPNSQFLRPTINYNGIQVRVPVVAKASNYQNFQAYVNTVISQSNFAQLAPEILSAFANVANIASPRGGYTSPTSGVVSTGAGGGGGGGGGRVMGATGQQFQPLGQTQQQPTMYSGASTGMGGLGQLQTSAAPGGTVRFSNFPTPAAKTGGVGQTLPPAAPVGRNQQTVATAGPGGLGGSAIPAPAAKTGGPGGFNIPAPATKTGGAGGFGVNRSAPAATGGFQTGGSIPAPVAVSGNSPIASPVGSAPSSPRGTVGSPTIRQVGSPTRTVTSPTQQLPSVSPVQSVSPRQQTGTTPSVQLPRPAAKTGGGSRFSFNTLPESQTSAQTASGSARALTQSEIQNNNDVF